MYIFEVFRKGLARDEQGLAPERF